MRRFRSRIEPSTVLSTFTGERSFDWNVAWLDANLTILNDANYQTHLSTGATVSVCLRTSTSDLHRLHGAGLPFGIGQRFDPGPEVSRVT